MSACSGKFWRPAFRSGMYKRSPSSLYERILLMVHGALGMEIWLWRLSVGFATVVMAFAAILWT
ncbi:hypothetical protein D3C72_2252150 [compost metagenome]